jgi:hypothetical protein
MAKFQFTWLDKRYYFHMLLKHCFDPFIKVMRWNDRVLILCNQSKIYARFCEVEKAFFLSKKIPKGVFVCENYSYVLLDGYVVKQEQLDQTQIQFYRNLGYEMVDEHIDLRGQKMPVIHFKKRMSLLSIMMTFLYLVLGVQMTYLYINQPPTKPSISEIFLKIRPFIKDHIDYLKITSDHIDIRPKSSFDDKQYQKLSEKSDLS